MHNYVCGLEPQELDISQRERFIYLSNSCSKITQVLVLCISTKVEVDAS
jgi:hypothetical protein